MAKKKAAKKGPKRATKKRSKQRSMKKSGKMSRRKGAKKGAAKKAASKSSKRSAKRAARRAPRKVTRVIPATIPTTSPMAGAAVAPSSPWHADSSGDESGLLGGGDEEGSRRSGVTSHSSHQQSFDEYVQSLPSWQRDAASQLRAILLEAAPQARESIKWGQPVYEARGPFAYIKAHRKYLNFGFWRGTDLADPKQLLEGEGGQMRHVKIESLDAIDRDALRQFVLDAVALNEQKGRPNRGRATSSTADHAADARAAAAVGLSEVVR